MFGAYNTIEVSYMDQSESTRDPPPLSSDKVDTTQYGRTRTRHLSDSRPQKPVHGTYDTHRDEENKEQHSKWGPRLTLKNPYKKSKIHCFSNSGYQNMEIPFSRYNFGGRKVGR